MNMQKALETKSLTLSYGETIIINELNLEIPKRENYDFYRF